MIARNFSRVIHVDLRFEKKDNRMKYTDNNNSKEFHFQKFYLFFESSTYKWPHGQF